MQSFDWRTLKAMQKIAPEIERVCITIEAPLEDNIQRGRTSPWTAGLKVDDFAGSVPRLVQAAGCATWSPYYRNITATQVKEAQTLGLKAIPWTVNEMDDLKLVIETGIDGLITDYPDRGRAALPKSVTPPPAIPERLAPSQRLIASALLPMLRFRRGATTMAKTPYDIDLDRNPANYQPLTPLQFLERAATVYPDHTAIVHGPLRRNYRDFYARARQLASALRKRGIKKGDTVSVVLANTPAMLECHYGVPMAGAVLNTINTRLDAAVNAFTLDHADTKVLIVDREFSAVMKDALSRAKVKPLVIDYDDPEFAGENARIGALEYEDFVKEGDPDFAWAIPDDEWDAISLNYTSGTTGDPKGVVYHHRGAYLLAIGNVLTGNIGRHPVYLWTLPMFHCNGWCFPWSISIGAGTHICLRQVRAAAMYDLIATHKVTHLCGAPIVMATLLNAPADEKKPLPHVVEFFTAAAPPPEAVLAGMKVAGFNVTHLYGLTEILRPCRGQRLA